MSKKPLKKYYAIFWITRGREVLEDVFFYKKHARERIKSLNYFAHDDYIIREMIPGREAK